MTALLGRALATAALRLEHAIARPAVTMFLEHITRQFEQQIYFASQMWHAPIGADVAAFRCGVQHPHLYVRHNQSPSRSTNVDPGGAGCCRA